ncbi:hypothetical protein [Marinifilum flexuosum]|uniref:Uncharacterized protein n=1 Tax=Marinifilum flexuosum TaxID=1117708 RepID=A0A419X3M2_9BACT|nr:hypothetical protein [Marinifilum flexuosum]RKE02325.1 hypothetical protein BXY64_2413 [Marinifilum flexuosum]
MANKEIIDPERLKEMFADQQQERKAFVLLPSIEGFTVFEVEIGCAKLALTAQALKENNDASTKKRQNDKPAQR